MPLPRKLTLSEAADEIRATCGRHTRPFFFMVGAGVSHPTVPLAPALVEHFREQAGSAQPSSNQTAMDAYAWWFERAYASPGDRQQYLQSLIEKKPITDANLRLAHLLLGGKFANLVVTTNFDDFISKALTLFGETHIVCDHPQTVLRIDPEREGLQIVHVHGSYWFYDCCNLAGEIEERAVNSRDEPSSMRDFLDRLLLNRSPIVVGYSGWEGDVFMSALKRRMKAGLKFNVYWFCYKAANIGDLPPFLQSSRDVRFVVRAEPPKTPEDSSGGGKEWLRAGRATREGESQREPVLPAADVFDELIRQFNLEAPLLTRDPLGYLAEHLRRSLPRAGEGTPGQDLYRIGTVIETVEGAKAALKRAVVEPLRDALRRSQYREAVREAEKIGLMDLDSDQVREVMVAMTDAARGLFDNSPEELAAYELTLAAGDRLLEQGGFDGEFRAKVAWALLYKGITLGQLNRSEEEIAVYDEVARRFGEAAEPALRELVARALVNKGVTLGQLNRSEEEIAVYDEVARRIGEAAEPALREQVARALVNKGITLGQLNRSEEEIAVYDEVARRFGEAAEPALRELVARALVNKGVTLGQLSRSEEAIAVYDEVLRQFGEATEPALREQVARALVNKGVTLGQLDRSEAAIAVYDEVARRFGEATEPALREQVARALISKGVTLGELNRSEAAIAVYDEVARRFGEATEPALREQVARALVNKGVTLGELNRSEEEIAVYDEVARRFGEATEPALRELVAMALVNKGFRLGELNRSEAAIAVYDEVARRFGEATEPALREQVARALVNKGFRLGELNRSEAAIAVYDEVARRFGEATEPALREPVAMALVNKGITLGQLNRSEEEIAVYDEVLRRFGEATEPALRELVARALVNKGVTLGQLSRSEEAIAVYDEVLRQFGEATEPALREQVARALVNKGVTLGQLDRSEAAIAVYDEVARRFGEATEPALREQVARALISKGVTLGELNRSEAAIAVYDEVARRFGEATEPALREQVARALVNKGVTLGELNRSEEEIAVYDEVARRFGEATEPALREQVARALNGSGFTDLCRAKTHRKAGEDDQAQSALSRARKRLQEGLERNPNSDEILGNLGYAEFLSGEREAARRYLERAIAIGGQEIRQSKLADAERDALPEDEEFKKLVLSIPLPAAKPA